MKQLLFDHQKAATKSLRVTVALVGTLQHTTKLILKERSFLCRVYTTASKVCKLHYYIRLGRDSRSDLSWWDVYFLPVERSELDGKYPPSGKSAHVPTREGQVFKAKVRVHAHFYAACYVCVGYPAKYFLRCPDDP